METKVAYYYLSLTFVEHILCYTKLEDLYKYNFIKSWMKTWGKKYCYYSHYIDGETNYREVEEVTQGCLRIWVQMKKNWGI